MFSTIRKCISHLHSGNMPLFVFEVIYNLPHNKERFIQTYIKIRQRMVLFQEFRHYPCTWIAKLAITWRFLFCFLYKIGKKEKKKYERRWSSSIVEFVFNGIKHDKFSWCGYSKSKTVVDPCVCRNEKNKNEFQPNEIFFRDLFLFKASPTASISSSGT